MNEPSLRESLKAPALRKRRWELEQQIKDVPVNSPEFRQLAEDLRALNLDITKAQAQDDLLTMEALVNVNFRL